MGLVVILVEDKRLSDFLRIVKVSRAINLLLIFLVFPGWVTLGVIFNAKWLGLTAMLLICISGIVPALFILINTQWIAQAWLRGMNPHFFPETPWEQLPKGKKFSVYFYSAISFIASIVGILLITPAIS